MRKLFFSAALLWAAAAGAQMPNDGFVMSRGELCTVAGFGYSTWTHYWEGERLRNNLNIGRFTSKAFMPMLGYGVSKKLNLFAGAAYINNTSDAGTMAGQRGWQDFSAAFKYELIGFKNKNHQFKLFGGAGFSAPLTNYIPDYLPYSIGSGSRTANARLIAHHVFQHHFFATAQSGYTYRRNIKLQRMSYFTDRQVESNEMAIPNLVDASLQVGYTSKNFRAAVHYAAMRSLAGTDIRRNDMPLPANRMNNDRVGVYALWWLPILKGLGVHATVEQSVSGRNTGKAFTATTGVQYVFVPFKKKNNATAQ